MQIQTAKDLLPPSTGATIQFDGQLMMSDGSSTNVAVEMDDDGIRFTTKKDNVYFGRERWLDVAVDDNALVVIVQGYSYDQWSKKRKFEKKNPDQPFEFEEEVAVYAVSFKPKKLVGLTVEDLSAQTNRNYIQTYLDEADDPNALRFVSCPQCLESMDVTPYADSPNLFCNTCCKLMGKDVGGEAENHGVCDSCSFYSKLADFDETTKTCHRCRVKLTMRKFWISILVAAGIVVLNFLTLFFADRFFPVLIALAAFMLLANIWFVVKLIALSAARKAVGATEIEQATELLRKGKAEKAYDVINAMEGNTVENPGILLNLAKGLSKAGKHEQAEDIVASLIEDYPNFHFGHLAKVDVLSAKNAPDADLETANEHAFEVLGRNTLRSAERTKLISLFG